MQWLVLWQITSAWCLQKDEESRPTATEPPPGPFRPVNPAAKTYLVQELPASKKATKAGGQEPAKQVGIALATS